MGSTDRLNKFKEDFDIKYNDLTKGEFLNWLTENLSFNAPEKKKSTNRIKGLKKYLRYQVVLEHVKNGHEIKEAISMIDVSYYWFYKFIKDEQKKELKLLENQILKKGEIETYYKVLNSIKKGGTVKEYLESNGIVRQDFYMSLTSLEKEKLKETKKTATKQNLNSLKYKYTKLLDEKDRIKNFNEVLSLIRKGYGITESLKKLKIPVNTFYHNTTEAERSELKREKKLSFKIRK